MSLALPASIDFSTHTDDEICGLLKTLQLNLTPTEVRKIQNEFLNRPPTYAECVLWSIQGSEHCSYKSTRKHLQTFPTEGPHVILGPKEDAGIVEIAKDHQGKRYGLVVSHESHNHPSQIVPFEGAATGVGGNVRDVSCMGAEVVAIADSLRFGDIQQSQTHFIAQGVIEGIGGYGNPLGIPTIAGDLYFDPGYNGNCLVTVVTLGIVREDHIIHSYAPENAENYVFVLVGKPTDNSGFGGASFASADLEQAEQESNKGAVQEPNAFLQRHILKANYALFRKLQEDHLIDRVGFKDLGAGGIACASVELADAGGYGAEIELDAVPVGIDGLNPAVILCAETQERFMWVVPADLAPMILSHYNETYALPQVSKGACAKVIGKLRQDDRYVVHYQQEKLVDARARDITQGILYDRPYTKSVSEILVSEVAEPTDYNATLLALLAHENIASRACVFETYDKQVQGRTLVEAGRADAGILQVFNEEKYPVEIRQIGVALSIDHNPRYCKIDAYWGAVNAVIEAVRNVAAVGATPIAITDCLCFGNPEKATEMQKFVDAVHGISDACRAIKMKNHPEHHLPIISGNVSLYNESNQQAIPPSPIISCVGVIDDVARLVTSDFKLPGNYVVLIGDRDGSNGGSAYYALQGVLGHEVPKPNLKTINAEISALTQAITQGYVSAAHDISEGGLAVALAEMTFTHEIGVTVNLHTSLRADHCLFAEGGGFLLEVAREHLKPLQTLFLEAQIPAKVIGVTQKNQRIIIEPVIDVSIADAKAVWTTSLRERLM